MQGQGFIHGEMYMKKEQILNNSISEKAKYHLPLEMQEHWTVYESLKESEDS